MKIKIFYSWQSDLPNKTNRTLIEEALENVARGFEADVVEAERPRIEIDSATKGVAGSVNIAESILKKIRECQVFVADVSIVGEIEAVKKDKAARKSPNPNVLFELGYALRHLGENNTILVMNFSYGRPEDLPFDLRMRRTVGYDFSGSGDKAPSRIGLENHLKEALRLIVAEMEQFREAETETLTSVQNDTIRAIESSAPNQLPQIQRYMRRLIEEIDKINSEYVPSENHAETIRTAIDKSEPISINFAKVIDSLSTINDLAAARKLYDGLLPIFERYRLRSIHNPDGRRDDDFDFYKFVGHELTVIFFSFQIRNGNWETIHELLKRPLYVSNLPGNGKLTSIGYIPQTLRTFEDVKLMTKSNRFSLHADILAKRYREGEIGTIISFQEFMDADLFLFLYFEFNRNESDYYQWIPQSGVYNYGEAPKFLYEAEDAAKANEIGHALLVSRDQFVAKLASAIEKLRMVYSTSRNAAPLQFYDPNMIGSR